MDHVYMYSYVRFELLLTRGGIARPIRDNKGVLYQTQVLESEVGHASPRSTNNIESIPCHRATNS